MQQSRGWRRAPPGVLVDVESDCPRLLVRVRDFVALLQDLFERALVGPRLGDVVPDQPGGVVDALLEQRFALIVAYEQVQP